MAALLERRDQSISITDFIRTAKKAFDALTSGKQDRFVVMKNNNPSAVVLPVDTFEAMQNELEDLRLQVIAVERLAGIDAGKAISHADMAARYSDEDED
ncbi:MAG TPA: type II toxin-antitoxin system Phd/YefM family antitoxin [Bacteroidetes bacterium]|nr:type II toxin-antitoxin system Phd/YefM family antitoxin [Bacteroidota bacterium]HEX04704.1 type II toxin-antitoxin system Phd/YefM family antitoxin [Bacteroidota bacterium]